MKLNLSTFRFKSGLPSSFNSDILTHFRQRFITTGLFTQNLHETIESKDNAWLEQKLHCNAEQDVWTVLKKKFVSIARKEVSDSKYAPAGEG